MACQQCVRTVRLYARGLCHACYRQAARARTLAAYKPQRPRSIARPGYRTERAIQPGELSAERRRVHAAWRGSWEPLRPVTTHDDTLLSVARRRRILLTLDHYETREATA